MYDWTQPLDSAEVQRRLERLNGSNSRCILRLRADVHAALHKAQNETRNMMPEVFNGVRVRTLDPVNYQIAGVSNQFAFAQVERLGAPKYLPDGSRDDLPPIQEGDIVGLDLGQVGHELPKRDGVRRCLALWEILLCTFREGDEYPTPLGDCVMTRERDAITNAFAFNGSKLIAPIRRSGVTRTNDRPGSRVGLHCEEVVASGPGKTVRHKLLPGGFQRGDWVMFTNACSVDLMWRRGELLRFTPASKIEGCMTERDPYAAG